MPFAINAGNVRDAAARITSCVRRTPVLTSSTFDAMTGVSTFFKAENFQRGGAFKIRGASNFLAQIPAGELAAGVVAFSSGNHAQAVAIAARDRGVSATIVMPDDAPRAKVEATRGYGARIVIYDRLKDDREEIGRRISAETGATLVPPYDHPWTIAGQGTTALELLEQAPDLDAIITPVGGGGLLAGCAIAAKYFNPGIRVFGAEPEDGNDTHLSMRAGDRVTIPAPATVADGLRAVRPGALTFPIVQALAEDILLVSEDEIRAAMRFLLTRMKLVVEPSGAVPAAAVMSGKLPAGIQRIGVVLSGGNVDLDVLRTL
ncbi:MAG TPA: pyridoxal-phosphate dependent enzyme [Bryobacteraceae bacterium]|nr:pyridoxal-phosphate dependent enzyme [Bryobacteraceae bacterium]